MTKSAVSRNWFWAGFFAFVLMLAGCGGGDGGPTSSTSDGGPTSFTSDDGVVSVEVPPGAAPDSFSGTVTKGDLSVLGVDISDVESALLVYQLGPDGTEFDEPVMVTFRISPALGGFDPDLGLPLSLVVIEDDAGGFEPLGSMTSFLDGDVLVVEGTTTHFSTAVVEVINGHIELVVDPPGRRKNVDSLFEVRIEESGATGDEDDNFAVVGRVDYSSERPIEIFAIESNVATMECIEEGEGTIDALVFGADIHSIGGNLDLLGAWLFVHLLTGGSFEFFGSLSLDIECVDDLEEPDESVAVDPAAEGVVGEGTLTFQDFPGGPSTPGYEEPFKFFESGEGDESTWNLIQQQSSQETVGMKDPTGNGVITFGGQEEPHYELYVLRVWYIGSDQLGIVGVTFGGLPELAERGEELVLALTSAEIVDGVLVVAPGADPITGGPLDPEQAFELAAGMVTAGVDPADFGLGWFMAVHGVFDLSDPTETGQGVPEHSVTIGNIRYVIRAVTEVRTGADLGFTVCGYDVDSGEPLEGETGYFTIGNDPGSSLASHANGIFGSDGCFSGSVHVQEPPPITQGFVSDGSTVEKWGDITIFPGEDPPEEDPEQFLRLLVDGLRGDVDFLVSRLNDATIAIYGEEQCRATLAGLQDPQTELEIREIGPIAPWDYVVDGVTTPIPDALPVEVQRLADGQTIIQELHWQLVDGLWTWFSDCGDPIPG